MGIFDKKQKQAQGDQIKPQKNEGAQSVPPRLLGEKLSLEGDMIHLESQIIEYNVRLESIEQKVHQGNYLNGNLHLNGHLYETLNKDVANLSDKLESRRKRYIEVFGQEAYEKAKKECLEMAIKEARWNLNIMRQKPLKELSEYVYKESQNNHVVLYKEEKRKKQIELEDSPLQDNHINLRSKVLDEQRAEEISARNKLVSDLVSRYGGYVDSHGIIRPPKMQLLDDKEWFMTESLYQQIQTNEHLAEQNALLTKQNEILAKQIAVLEQVISKQKSQKVGTVVTEATSIPSNNTPISGADNKTSKKSAQKPLSKDEAFKRGVLGQKQQEKGMGE